METDLIISPYAFITFQDVADEFEINFELLTEDVQKWFDDERPAKKAKAWGFDQYNTYEDILLFLTQMQTNYPGVAEIFNVGSSFESRAIKGIRITKNLNNPAVFIESNIHAREWITSATAVWLINEFLTSSNSSVRSFVDGITWYIVPMLNVDGKIS